MCQSRYSEVIHFRQPSPNFCPNTRGRGRCCSHVQCRISSDSKNLRVVSWLSVRTSQRSYLVVLPPLKILLPRCRYPRPKHWALDLHIDMIKRIHNCFDPILIDLSEELLDRLFRLWCSGVGSDRCAGSTRACSSWLGWLVEEKKFDIFAAISSTFGEKNREEVTG